MPRLSKDMLVQRLKHLAFETVEGYRHVHVAQIPSMCDVLGCIFSLMDTRLASAIWPK